MCKLISIKNNLGEDIKVADIKADTIKKILMLTETYSDLNLYVDNGNWQY
jgi:hypothetical protein